MKKIIFTDFQKMFILFAIIILISSCGKDDEINPDMPPDIDPNALIHDNVKVSNSSLNDLIISIDSSKIVFDGEHTILEELIIGDVLVSDIHEKVPFGYALKVINIQKDGSITILETEWATLNEIFEKANFDISYDFGEKDTLLRTGGESFQLIDNYLFPSLDGSIDLDCDFKPKLIFDLAINESELDYAKIGLNLDIDYSMNATLGTPSGEVKVTLYPEKIITPKVIIVGSIPIVITPKWGIYGVGSYSADVNLNLDIGGSANFNAYMEYTKELGWTPISNKTLNNTQFDNTLQDNVNLNAMVGIQPELSVTLYNIDAVKTTLNSRLYAEGNVILSQDLSEIEGECFGIGLRLGGKFKMKILDETIADFETIVFDEKLPIVGNNDCDDCPETLIDLRDGQSYPTIKIGDMCWMAKNLNIGNMITSLHYATDHGFPCCLENITNECSSDLHPDNQTNNSTIEKFCYNNDPANCDLYGGLYQWGELMGYTDTLGAKGICPNGWHIPTDEEWKQLEISLGMSETEANSFNFRGTNQGDQLKLEDDCFGTSNCGTSGFNSILSGYRVDQGTFQERFSITSYWTSSKYDNCNSWKRHIYGNSSQVQRFYGNGSSQKFFGSSCRCVKD